jgi:hypothetical protein
MRIWSSDSTIIPATWGVVHLGHHDSGVWSMWCHSTAGKPAASIDTDRDLVVAVVVGDMPQITGGRTPGPVSALEDAGPLLTRH